MYNTTPIPPHTAPHAATEPAAQWGRAIDVPVQLYTVRPATIITLQLHLGQLLGSWTRLQENA
jgi:hypothetical protein